MQVLVCLTGLFDQSGGVQTFNRCLVRSIGNLTAKHGWRVGVLSLNDREIPQQAKEEFAAAKVEFKGFARHRSSFALESIRMGRRADQVIFGHVNLSPLLLGMRASGKRPTVYIVLHGTEVWRRLPFLQRTALLQADQLLSVSHFTETETLKFNPGVCAERFLWFPDSLEPMGPEAGSNQTRETLNLPSGKMILSVSRLGTADRSKGIDQLIEALPSILSEVPDAFYVLVGEGPDRERLQALVRQKGLVDKVFFCGAVSGELLPAYYRTCDVFALPSRQDGFGIVFLEAMQYAKPCVGYSAGGVPEVVQDGVTGILSDPGEKGQLKNAVVTLLQDRALSQRMGQAGRDRLTREFSPAMFEKRLEAALCR